MGWEIEATDEFGEWYGEQSAEIQASVDDLLALLEEFGPALKRPHVGTLKLSAYANMKELRVNDPPVRILFAFDPRRVAVVLVGGDKAADEAKFYKRMIRRADALFTAHLESLEK